MNQNSQKGRTTTYQLPKGMGICLWKESGNSLKGWMSLNNK